MKPFAIQDGRRYIRLCYVAFACCPLSRIHQALFAFSSAPAACWGSWLHEIKHDGIRIMARRDGAGVRLATRHGNDFTHRFPMAVAAISALSGRSFLVDGEAIVTNGDGLAVFDLIRRACHGDKAVLCAFDLIELDGEDLRRSPIEHRKHKLARLVRDPRPGIVLNEHYDGDGAITARCFYGSGSDLSHS